MNIRQESKEDLKDIFNLIKKAFEHEPLSDHKEQFLVERLRMSENFVPELSLVVETEGKVIGYILLTKIKIKNGKETFTSLALAPVAVLPEYQKRGIGTALIQYAHQQAMTLGFHSVVLLGHENYYPKFGYKKAGDFEIRLPFDVPDENCMAVELKENALQNVSGVVEYPKEFYE
ncbi:MAG: N-acetyltransferase [Niabella sp.]